MSVVPVLARTCITSHSPPLSFISPQVNYNDTNDGREDGNWQGENPSDYNSDFSVPSDDQDSDADLEDGTEGLGRELGAQVGRVCAVHGFVVKKAQ